MDIGAIGLLGAITVYITLIALLLNKRIDDLKAEFKDDMSEVKSDMKVLSVRLDALQEGQMKLIASVAWLMARAGATPDEVSRLYEDPQSGDD